MIKIQATYLIKKLPNLSKTTSEEIEQGYLSADPESLRVRKKGGTHLITRKIDLSGGGVEEMDMPITLKDYDEFLHQIKMSLKKTRYYISNVGGVNIRVDAFHGKIEGLNIAEVVFDSENVKQGFQPPEWFGREVSGEKWASNQYFASSSFEEIKSKISKE